MNNTPKRKIILFNKNEAKFKMNSLKLFLCFIKQTDLLHHLNNTYSSDLAAIHPNLSIKDNLILDALPTGLIKTDEYEFTTALESISNFHLKEFIHELGDFDKKICELNKDKAKLASIVKAFLSKGKYILLDTPELNLSRTQIEKLKKAMIFEVMHTNRKIMLTSDNENLWADTVTDFSYVESGKILLKENVLADIDQSQATTNLSFDFGLKAVS